MSAVRPISFLGLLLICVPASAQPGSIDTGFNPGGAGFGSLGGSAGANAMALQADGRILVAGSDLYNGETCKPIIRLNADGSLDPTFDLDTLVTSARELILRPDGKIFVLRVTGLYLIEPDGSVDPDFVPELGTVNNLSGMALMADGRLVVIGQGGGSFRPEPGKYLTVLNPDGSQDPSFVQEGFASSGFYALELDDAGRIYAGGWLYTGSPDDLTSYHFPRLLADGTVDTTFLAEGGPDFMGDILIQPDGRILTGTPFRRYMPDGSVDPDYATTSTGGWDPWIMAIAQQADGRTIIAGRFTHCNSVPTGGITRLNTDGTMDENFQTTGLGSSGWSEEISAVALQPDGKILVAGYFSSFDGQDIGGLVRLEGCQPGDPCGTPLGESAAVEPALPAGELYPNPYSSGPLTAPVPSLDGSASKVEITILDAIGHVVHAPIQYLTRSADTVTFQPNCELTSGIYFVTTTIGGHRSVHRLDVR